MVVGLNLNIKCNYNTIMKRLTTPDPGQVRFLQSWMQAALPVLRIPYIDHRGATGATRKWRSVLPAHAWVLPQLAASQTNLSQPAHQNGLYRKPEAIRISVRCSQVESHWVWCNCHMMQVNRIANSSFHDCIQLLAKMHSSLSSESGHSQTKPSFGYTQHHAAQLSTLKPMAVPAYSPINGHKPSPSLTYFPSTHSKQSSKPTNLQQ